MRNRGRYAEALELYQRAQALEDPNRDNLRDRGNLRYNIGITLSQLGRFGEAEGVLKEALAMWTQVYGAESGSAAKAELALATIDRQNQNFAAAEKRYLSVLAIWTQINGPTSTNVAFGLNNLGNNYLEQKEFVRAEQKYREALEIFESRLGKSHPNVAMTLANLGRCLVSQNRHPEAIPLLRRVVAIDEKTGSAQNADLGWDRLFLAQALWHQDRAAAREEAKAGLEILDREVGRDHPELRKWMEEHRGGSSSHEKRPARASRPKSDPNRPSPTRKAPKPSRRRWDARPPPTSGLRSPPFRPSQARPAMPSPPRPAVRSPRAAGDRRLPAEAAARAAGRRSPATPRPRSRRPGRCREPSLAPPACGILQPMRKRKATNDGNALERKGADRRRRRRLR